MSYLPFTNVPNTFFPLIATLGYAELKVLLIIIRQTYGFVDPRTKKHKQYDWISGRFFVRKTALSQRSVSEALSSLLKRGLYKLKTSKESYAPLPASVNELTGVTTAFYRHHRSKQHQTIEVDC